MLWIVGIFATSHLPIIAQSGIDSPSFERLRRARPSSAGAPGENNPMREFIADKWPELVVALGFAMTWTAIVYPWP